MSELRKHRKEKTVFGHMWDVFDRFAYVIGTIDTARSVIVLLGMGLISTLTIWLAPDGDEENQQTASAAPAIQDQEMSRAIERDNYNRDMAAQGWGYSEEGDETAGSFGESNY